MEGMIVKEGNFPHRRKTLCCGKAALAGESVIVIDHRQGGALKGHTVLHKRCIEALCEDLPVDANDSRSQFLELRERIIATGTPFPKKRRHGPKRGVVVDLDSRRR